MIAAEVTEGRRVVLARDVERFPHFTARAGASGEIIEATAELVSVRLDAHLPGAEEWDNEICWSRENASAPAWDAREAAAAALARRS